MTRFINVKALIFVSLLLVAAAITATAQTSRRTPKPMATPLPTLSGAEIISRAGDLIDTQPVLPPPTVKTASTTTIRIKELTERVNKLESTQKNDYDEKQKRMLLNLDILTRAEQRSESLRKQLFDMIEKENTIKSRLDQIETDSRPEMIERTLQLAGSMKPEEIRDIRRKSLASEKSNLQALLNEIQSTRTNLTFNLQKADIMVEKLRAKLEKDIDESFLKEDEKP